MKKDRKHSRRWPAAVLAVMLVAALCPAALADTDDSTPIMTQRPDQLVLQLGARWAGVEFELRTDAGVFPAPVVVSESGVLTMDLGGSTTYTLSCLDSSVPIPDPTTGDQADPVGGEDQTVSPQPEKPGEETTGIPVMHIVLFLGGLLVCGGGLLAMHLIKRRRQSEYEWDDGDEEL